MGEYLSLTGHIYAPAIIAMSKAAHESSRAPTSWYSARRPGSPPAERKFMDGVESAGLASCSSVGMKINDDVDKAAFRAALAPAYAKWRQQFGDLIDRIQAHK